MAPPKPDYEVDLQLLNKELYKKKVVLPTTDKQADSSPNKNKKYRTYYLGIQYRPDILNFFTIFIKNFLTFIKLFYI